AHRPLGGGGPRRHHRAREHDRVLRPRARPERDRDRGVGAQLDRTVGDRAVPRRVRRGVGVVVDHRGEQLGIYPEGTRSPDGKLYRGRTGIARMILEGRVTVVPVAM
ncbi:1-acyl-sn-glycerol-3-phosphate acyltransferase, partial [Bacillus sp. S34]|nr:1-acyl-sn-glycerol-3-phosphate acyltransferase [Bacillus sp. S34]